MKYPLREITFLVAARTAACPLLPMYWSRDRQQAIRKAHNVKTSAARDAATKLKLATGPLLGVMVIELINGGVARQIEITLREPVDSALVGVARNPTMNAAKKAVS